MTKRNVMHSIFFALRLIMLISLIFFLVQSDYITTTVIFVIAISINVSEFVMVAKYKKIPLVLKILSCIIDRLIYFIPLIFACREEVIPIWILIVMMFFDIIIILYKSFASPKEKQAKIFLGFYVLYCLLLSVCVLSFLFFDDLITYMVLAESIVATIFILYASAVFGEDGKIFEEEQEEPEEEKTELEKDLSADTEEDDSEVLE